MTCHSKRLVALAKYRAKRDGIPFDLSYEDVEIPVYCPVLGIKLERNVGGKNQHDFSPTLDRIKPELGYVRGNVIVISSRANSIKSNANPDELELVAGYFRQLIQ